MLSPSSRVIAVALFCLLVPGFALADLVPIQINGYFEDWAGLAHVLDDSNDDAGPVDFGRVWVANDQDYLYIRFETEGHGIRQPGNKVFYYNQLLDWFDEHVLGRNDVAEETLETDIDE